MKPLIENKEEWKTKNKLYIKELQKMFDIIENVQDEDLKNRILLQYAKCDKVITELAKEHSLLENKKPSNK